MTDIYADYNAYFTALQKVYSKEVTKEHSGRTALENLLNAVVASIGKPRRIIQEPKSEQGSAPDFKVEHATAIIGYLENKKPSDNLEKTAESDQIVRYKKLSRNIMLTNYHEWIWIKDGITFQTLSLFSLEDLQNPKARLNPEKIDKLHRILSSFMEAEAESIGDSKKFAEALAVRTWQLSEEIQESLAKNKQGPIIGLYNAFIEQLHPQLEIEEFSSTFAQMLAFGIFLARLNDKKGANITLKNAEDFIPQPFALMRELVGLLRYLNAPEYENLKWIVEEMLAIINYMDREAIAESLSFKYRSSRSLFKGKDADEFELFSTDPFIYFYEDFLAAYNKKTRKNRGVYYTPPPIVNFIIQSLDGILKDVFKISEGFADAKKVTALDFACGTGTFMLEIFKQILETTGKNKRKPVIKSHLLKNIYGFEYLIAAYAVAHLKLWQFLSDKDYKFKERDRLQILLTNTLEPTKEMDEILWVPKLTEEAELGSQIKDGKILVITGNPPYNFKSENPSKVDGKLNWIGQRIEDYKKINGKSIGGRNPKALQDDYVKFIRFAEHKMESQEEGVIGIITNHGFIDNITFSGMRYHLLQTFDRIYILDLHGNSKRGEKSPDGSKDENVFDIQQGVSISFFIKKKGIKKGVFHHDLWGRRIDKYRWALSNSLKNVKWKKLLPEAPDYLFVPQDNISLKPEYDEGWSVDDIFTNKKIGVTTARDELTIQFTKELIQEKVKEFSQTAPEEAIGKFNLKNDTQAWKIEWAQEDIKKHGQDEHRFKPILYRAFDKRFTYYSGKSDGFISRPRASITESMFFDNLALVTVKQNSPAEFSKVFISKNMVDCHLTGGDMSYVFPLYLIDNGKSYNGNDKNGAFNFQEDNKKENFSENFRNFIDEKYDYRFSPEEILSYIYAILHSPSYRNRYQEFFSFHYPKILFCDDKQHFRKIAKIGHEIMELHLMKSTQANSKLWHGESGDFLVDKIRYDERNEKLYINASKYLCKIKKSVWEFQIGGDFVLKEYLDSRKGQHLELVEISHIEEIVDAIEKTLSAMKKLDKLTEKSFPHWHQ